MDTTARHRHSAEAEGSDGGGRRVLALAAVVDAVGTGCFLAGSALFFVRELGLTPAQVGLGLSLSAAIGLAVTVPAGVAAERVGVKRVLVALLLLRAAGFLAYTLVDSFGEFILVAATLGLAEKPTAPLQQALLARVVGDAHRQRMLALTRSLRNAGFAAGALVAGLLVMPGFPIGLPGLVLVNAASFGVTALIVGSLEVPLSRPAAVTPPVHTGPGGGAVRLWHVPDARYLRLTLVNGLLTVHMTLLSTAVPLWLLERTDLPEQLIPVLVLINTALAVVLQVPAASAVRTERQARGMLAAAGGALAVTCVLLSAVPHVSIGVAVLVAVGAVVALTAGELTQAAGGWDLSFRLAPPHAQVRYLSVFSMGMTAQTIVAPWVLTALVMPLGTTGWLAAAALMALVGVHSGRGAAPSRGLRRACHRPKRRSAATDC